MKDIIKEFEVKMGTSLSEYRKDSGEVKAGFYADIVSKAEKRVMRDILAVYNEWNYDSMEDAWTEHKDDIISNTLEPMHRDMKKYSWYKPDEVEKSVADAIDARFSMGKSDLTEDRPTNALGFIGKLREHPMVDRIVDIHSQIDGYTALIRTKDGNAYEIDIRPASLAKKHPELTGKKT